MIKVALTFVRGFTMGAADIVPGVSGGTIALIFGIYSELLRNVRQGAKALGSFAKFNIDDGVQGAKRVDWLFVVPLAAGLLAAVKLLSSEIEQLLRDRPEEMAGLFFGLVVASFVIAWQMIRVRRSSHLLIALVVGAAAFFLLGFQSGPQTDPPLWAYFIAGSIAVCATILPGISGSFILLMMGMYAAVLTDLHNSAFVNLSAFVVGMAIGLGLFSAGLGWMLDNHHDLLLAALVGLMLGSLRVLWPWPNGVGRLGDDEIESVSGTGLELPTSTNVILPTVLAAGACVGVLAIDALAKRYTNTPQPDQEPAQV